MTTKIMVYDNRHTGQTLLDFAAATSKKKHRTSQTSRDAFHAIRSQLPARALKALTYIRDRGDEGATDEEVAIEFGWPLHSTPSITGRILFRQHKLIADSGRKRPNKSGAMARVWVLKTGANDVT